MFFELNIMYLRVDLKVRREMKKRWRLMAKCNVNKCIEVTQYYFHFPHQSGRKEGNVLFNDALNTFYLRLYGVRHMVKDHTDSERGNPLPPHRLLFPINSRGSFLCTIRQTGLHIPRPLLHQSWSTGWNEK